jgi:hypothetical protein
MQYHIDTGSQLLVSVVVDYYEMLAGEQRSPPQRTGIRPHATQVLNIIYLGRASANFGLFPVERGDRLRSDLTDKK